MYVHAVSFAAEKVYFDQLQMLCMQMYWYMVHGSITISNACSCMAIFILVISDKNIYFQERLFVCLLSVCMFVGSITQNVMNGLP